jgi:hypothetical protein
VSNTTQGFGGNYLMRLCTISTLILTIVIFASCSVGQRQRPNSRVSYFHYGGYGDTLYATLEGQVFRLDPSLKTKDSLIPLSDVAIKVVEYNKTYFTDSNGQFIINLDKGIFNLLVARQGLQPLQIKNYVSDPDQFSDIRIYLEPGTKEQIFEIPNSSTKQ